MTDSKDCILGDEIERIPRELRIIFGNLLLTRRLEERMEEFSIDVPLSKSERHMLVHLGVPRRMGRIAEDLNTQPSTVTAVADELERKGLLERARDPDDRRAWKLRLTDRGTAARRDLIETTVAKFREITGLDAKDMDDLAALMDRVTARILETGFPKGLTL
ncbi:MarR family winged helix-turn-helix transcriptional regulator [Tropicimonas sp. IMCC6043]|uniref:MarR family winged helix-turn-helix transcriptional regulator n=1 Tax=Tropicimonas sp. IMCC6043 TaxID=2510645 RepID=UPI0013ECC8DF|nr:MarR family transcriptional regulator [Tropicimonas sp. IMCC6043]